MRSDREYSAAVVDIYTGESKDHYASGIRQELQGCDAIQLIDTVNAWEEKLLSYTAAGREILYVDVLIQEIQAWLDKRYPLVRNK